MSLRHRAIRRSDPLLEYPIDSSDLKLPKVDGLEILQRCKSDPRTKNIPVVILTSSREDRDLIESYKLGVNSYIVKPVEFDNFAKVVSQIGFYWVLLNKPPY